MVRVELSAQQWKTDVLHRIFCRTLPCGDDAHAYVRLIADGKVFVDGYPLQLRPGLEDRSRPAAMGISGY